MKIINAALRHQSGLFTLSLEDGVIAAIDAQPALIAPVTAPDVLDAKAIW